MSLNFIVGSMPSVAIKYRFPITSSYLREARKRYRRTQKGANAKRWLAGLVALAIIIIGALTDDWQFPIFAALLGSIIWLIWRTMRTAVNRHLAGTPWLRKDVTVTLTDEAIRFDAAELSNTIGWPLIRSAYCSQDGVSLDVPPQTIWLADSDLIEGTADEVRQFLSSKIPKYKQSP